MLLQKEHKQKCLQYNDTNIYVSELIFSFTFLSDLTLSVRSLPATARYGGIIVGAFKITPLPAHQVCHFTVPRFFSCPPG